MISNASWDYFILKSDGERLVASSPDKKESSYLIYLLSSGFVSRDSDVYTLTPKGVAKHTQLLDSLDRLSKGIPISSKKKPLPEWFLLRRDNRTVKWFKGFARSSKLKFITDCGAVFGGNSLMNKRVSINRTLYLYYFPPPKSITRAVVTLVEGVYKLKPRVVMPVYYQRRLLSNPGVVWFRDIDGRFYSMSCVYYDYLLHWSGRLKEGSSFGVVSVGDAQHFVVDCPSAKGQERLIGDMIAVIAQVKTRGYKNAEMS